MSSKNPRGPSRQQLLAEVEDLRARLGEADENLRAIRQRDVDAMVLSGSKGEQISSLTGTDHVYRLLVETMNEAALTVSLEGRVLFCNQRFGQLITGSGEQIVGRPLTDFVTLDQKASAAAMLRKSRTEPVRQRLGFQNAEGIAVPVHVSSSILNQPDGSSICIIATDLTELEASSEMLQQLRRQKEALQDEIGRASCRERV
jgi:PAS domain S-box-containing protein